MLHLEDFDVYRAVIRPDLLTADLATEKYFFEIWCLVDSNQADIKLRSSGLTFSLPDNPMYRDCGYIAQGGSKTLEYWLAYIEEHLPQLALYLDAEESPVNEYWYGTDLAITASLCRTDKVNRSILNLSKLPLTELTLTQMVNFPNEYLLRSLGVWQGINFTYEQSSRCLSLRKRAERSRNGIELTPNVDNLFFMGSLRVKDGEINTSFENFDQLKQRYLSTELPNLNWIELDSGKDSITLYSEFIIIEHQILEASTNDPLIWIDFNKPYLDKVLAEIKKQSEQFKHRYSSN